MFEQEFNFVSEENNVKINYCSSQTKGCDCKNILSNNRKSIWLSEKSVPQIIVIDLSKMEKNQKIFFLNIYNLLLACIFNKSKNNSNSCFRK